MCGALRPDAGSAAVSGTAVLRPYGEVSTPISLGDYLAMKRRQFLAVSSLALAMPGAVIAGGGQVEYSRAAFDELLASGKPVLLDFYTTW